jgi:hypothetical protein
MVSWYPNFSHRKGAESAKNFVRKRGFLCGLCDAVKKNLKNELK